MLNLKGIQLTFSRNPEIKTVKSDFSDGYTNILSLKEKDIEDLIGEVQEAVYSLAG